jgi:hypothetical protein
MRLQATLKVALFATLAVLAIPGSAFGQATRTWISGVGDDANPCSRTAPCKTLAGAMSKTAAGGQISGIDGGGFGAVTINKSLTIDLRRIWEPGVLTNVSNGITVNAAATDRVKILGLNINGLNSNFHGIRILQARSVKISDVHIFGFNRNGISVENANALTRVVVRNSTINDNGGNGVLVAPQGANAARVTLRDNNIDDNGCGVTASRVGADPAFNFAVNCGTGGAATATPVINAFGNAISDSERQAFFANGSTATIRIGRNDVTGSNSAPAIQAINSGSILTFNNNFVAGNPGGNGATTGSAGGPL